jgi:hypothetical protein
MNSFFETVGTFLRDEGSKSLQGGPFGKVAQGGFRVTAGDSMNA